MHRNLALHETSSIHELSGLENLHLAITAEYNLGLGFLPMPYSPFFYSTLPSLLSKKSVIYLRRWWFMNIRSGRECHQPMHIIDDFTTNTSLRVWVGLTPRVKHTPFFSLLSIGSTDNYFGMYCESFEQLIFY